MELASAAYAEGFFDGKLTDYVGTYGAPLKIMPTSNTLAAFIVRSLDRTFHDFSDDDQLAIAASTIQDAIDDLQRVLKAIEDRRVVIAETNQ